MYSMVFHLGTTWHRITVPLKLQGAHKSTESIVIIHILISFDFCSLISSVWPRPFCISNKHPRDANGLHFMDQVSKVQWEDSV